MYILASVFFLFGLIVGSFLNVAILRLHTGHSLAGRSGCMSCQQQLRWFELFPIVSFFALRGRCSGCGSSISHQYWMVELATGVLFALVMLQGWGMVQSICALAIVVTLVVLAAYDFRHTVLPNGVVYAFNALALCAHIPFMLSLSSSEAFTYSASVLISGGLVATPLFLLWLVSRGSWMGLGDAKLALGVGWALGLVFGFMALLIAFVVGAIVGVALLYGQRVVRMSALRGSVRQFTMKSEIPFGPFIILGFFTALFGGAELLQWFTALFI